MGWDAMGLGGSTDWRSNNDGDGRGGIIEVLERILLAGNGFKITGVGGVCHHVIRAQVACDGYLAIESSQCFLKINDTNGCILTHFEWSNDHPGVVEDITYDLRSHWSVLVSNSAQGWLDKNIGKKNGVTSVILCHFLCHDVSFCVTFCVTYKKASSVILCHFLCHE